MKRFLQKLFYGEPVGDPIFRGGGMAHNLVMRPVSGRRAGSFTFTHHGESDSVILETEDLKELHRAIEYILTMEQRT